MKDLSEVTACIVDYGVFHPLAQKISESIKRTYYYSPIEQEFRTLHDFVTGKGIPNVERIEEIFDPEIFPSIDLFVFPDIGWGQMQKFLVQQGKAVWGSMGMDEFELYRTRFLDLLSELGLPIINSEIKKGITELSDHLKSVEDKWIKIDKYRGDMETWHHIDFDHSQRKLEHLSSVFGALKEDVVFVVQDNIDTDIEIGYDGWTVDGGFPKSSFQGYEKKNQLYLGACKEYSDLPDAIKEVNEALSPILKESGYRNFIATEIRVKDDVPYFIDPTFRMPGQTGEQLLETCSNLAEVIWMGANGILIEPEFPHSYAVEATLHYTQCEDGWKIIKIPEETSKWVKLYRYCIKEDAYYFAPNKSDELGVVLGVGESIEEALDHLNKNLDTLKGEPINADIKDFNELMDVARKGERNGINFSYDPIPDHIDV